MENNTIARGIGLLLAAALLFGCFFAVNQTGRTEPADPRTETPERLQPEALSSGRTGGFTAASDSAAEEAPEDEPEPENTPEPGSTAEPSGAPEATPDGTGGDTPGGDTPGGDTGDDGGDDEPDDSSIITNLTDYAWKTIYPSDLDEPGFLPFYARALKGTLEIRQDGKLLQVNGRQDYKAELSFGRNVITIYRRENGATVESVNYTIYYRQKADKDNDSPGQYPPKIKIIEPNEDEGKWPYETSTANFRFVLQVTDTHTNKRLPASNIEVKIYGEGIGEKNGITLTAHGYSYEYTLQGPNLGDVNHYRIEITAWDEDGCSAKYREYHLTYHQIGEGDVTGKATIVIDATTVGMGILDIIPDVEVRQNVPISQIVLDALEDYGYAVEYAGTVKIGFYLRRLTSGGINTGTVPDRLWTMIGRDGISTLDSGTSDSLGERDYTFGSGWMYSINGSVYEDKGMDARYLRDGDTLYLRFTLSYGKDINGYGATGGGFGQFSEYCYRYIGGTETFIAHGEMKELDRQEPTETEDGYILRECVRCGEQERETLPATAPTPTPSPSPSPTEAPTPTPLPSPTEAPTHTPEPSPTEAPPTEAPTPTPPVNTPEPAAEPPKPEEPEGGNEK